MSEKSEVYFASLGSDFGSSFGSNVERLLTESGIADVVRSGHFVGVKCHFGERGNHAFISPTYVRLVIDAIKKLSGRVVLIDTNTLYMGGRGEAISHLETAHMHGFVPEVVGAPVMIADGLRGFNGSAVRIDGNYYEEVEIAQEIHNLDSLVVVSHFKGHDLTGFGGAIKNIGMGGATKKGKLDMHSQVRPYVDGDVCDGCCICIRWCPVDAITIVEEVAVIDKDECIGCAECISACPTGAVKISWDSASKTTQEKMVEHALGVIRAVDGNLMYMNFINNVSPACDCYSHNAPPIVKDIGVVSSSDIIAIDRCSFDLVKEEVGINELDGISRGEDKFRAVYPQIDSTIQLNYGEELGMGFQDYKLIDV